MVIVGTECKTCVVLREWLDQERAKREYYEQIVLTKAGVIHSSEADQIREDISFPSVHRITTLSSLRQQARQVVENRKPLKVDRIETIDELAKDEDKTLAEIIFERELNGKIQEAASTGTV